VFGARPIVEKKIANTNEKRQYQRRAPVPTKSANTNQERQYQRNRKEKP
jgi:hypothetical protein